MPDVYENLAIKIRIGELNLLEESTAPGFIQHRGGAVVDVPPVHGNLEVYPIVVEEYNGVPAEEAY